MEVNKHERKSRFDDAEADVDREPWLFREADGPNPLTIEATDWSTGHTKLGEAEFLNGTDREGKKWSVLVGSRIMQKHLIEGLVEEWDGEAGEFVVVETQGRVKPGEFVSIKYLGDRKGSKYDYPDFRISRKPPLQVESQLTADMSDFVPASAAQRDADIPF